MFQYPENVFTVDTKIALFVEDRINSGLAIALNVKKKSLQTMLPTGRKLSIVKNVISRKCINFYNSLVYYLKHMQKMVDIMFYVLLDKCQQWRRFHHEE